MQKTIFILGLLLAAISSAYSQNVFTQDRKLEEQLYATGLIHDAPQQNYSFGVSGGNTQGNYSIGLSYTSQEGLIGRNYFTSKYDRYSARINSEWSLIKGKDFDYFKFGENLQLNMLRNIWTAYVHVPASSLPSR